jgi:hypothetical protein
LNTKPTSTNDERPDARSLARLVDNLEAALVSDPNLWRALNPHEGRLPVGAADTLDQLVATQIAPALAALERIDAAAGPKQLVHEALHDQARGMRTFAQAIRTNDPVVSMRRSRQAAAQLQASGARAADGGSARNRSIMTAWFDRFAMTTARLGERRISRREALRATGHAGATTLVGAAIAGAVAPEADADGCLAACLAAVDNGFKRFVTGCQDEYLASPHSGADVIDLINCVVLVHRAFKGGVARCHQPFCGDRKRYPPNRRPPMPRPAPRPKPLPPAGTGPSHGRGAACGPDVFCDADQFCCTTNNSGQVLQFCLEKSQAAVCQGAITGGT